MHLQYLIMLKGTVFNEKNCRLRCDLSTCINLDDAQNIDLSGCGLKRIPKKLNESKFLNALDLSDNDISEISNLDTMHNLNYLNLGINQISKIKNLANLKSLKTLRLHDNELNKIEGLERLQNLEKLDLRYNHIKWIEGLQNNEKLKKISIQGNDLKSIWERQLLNEGTEFGFRGRELQQQNIAQQMVGLSEIKDFSFLTKMVEGLRRKIMGLVE